jgi:membrane protease YdiL (CAAX protease family)
VLAQSLAYGMLAAQVASVGAILLVVPRVVGRDWKRQIGVRVPAGLHVFLAVLVVPAFMLLAEGIQELFLRLTGITRPAANEALNGTFATVPLFVTLLAVAVGPGVVEEFWCRGFLGRGLCARYGLRWGVLATSVLFGMLHMDPSLVFITGLMGAYLHFVFLAARSIWVPVVLHLLNNGLTILALLSPTLVAAGKALQEDKQGYRAVIDIAALGLIVFASAALWTSRAKLSDDATASGWEPEYPGVSAPPPEAQRRIEYGDLSPAAMVLALGSFGVLAYLLSQYAS